MQNTRNKHNFTKKELVKAWGSFLFVLAALFLVAPLGVVFPLGSWIFLVFGHLGFYFFNVLLLAISIVLIVKGSLIKDYFSWIQILGYFVMMLGVITFSSAIYYKGMDLSAVSATLMANWNDSVSYYITPSIGGGYVGFAMYALLRLGTQPVALVLSVTLIILGLVLLFLEPIKMLISFLAGTISHNTAIANSRKAMRKLEKEAEANKEEEIEMPESPIRHVYSDATESRVERYSEPDTAEIIPPTTPRYNQESPGTSSGLHEAHFGEETTFQESLLSPNPAPYDFSSAPFDEPFSSTPAQSSPVEETPAPTPAPAKIVEPTVFIDDPLAEEPEIIAPTYEFETAQVAPAPAAEEPSYQATAPAPAPALSETFAEPTPAPAYSQITPEPTYVQPAPAPAPSYVQPAPTPAPVQVAPTPVAPEPAFVETNEFKDPNVTLADKREALISTFDPEKQIIIRQLHADMYEELPPYTLPGFDLLDEPKGGADPVSIQADCEFKKSLIDQLFVDMRVGAHVESYVVGPSVTRFNIAKDPNVRVGQIEGVISDLSIRLNGTATRFQAVVQGQSTSGLEIPNDKSTMVTLKEMLQSIPEGDKYKFHIPFGKDVTGQYVTGDIRKFPHMLIAGSTGSGKS
ncbi:MAG: hypothetical protein MJ238_01705, partial [Bacilli bacterium]|nr:hypothetical protein [Bacilli bacterium]